MGERYNSRQKANVDPYKDKPKYDLDANGFLHVCSLHSATNVNSLQTRFKVILPNPYLYEQKDDIDEQW